MAGFGVASLGLDFDGLMAASVWVLSSSGCLVTVLAGPTGGFSTVGTGVVWTSSPGVVEIGMDMLWSSVGGIVAAGLDIDWTSTGATAAVWPGSCLASNGCSVWLPTSVGGFTAAGDCGEATSTCMAVVVFSSAVIPLGSILMRANTLRNTIMDVIRTLPFTINTSIMLISSLIPSAHLPLKL